MGNVLRSLAHKVLDRIDPSDRIRTEIRMRREVSNPAVSWLKNISGLVHVGANTGQEAALYDWLGLDVLWVEPLPEAFAALQANIAPFPKQSATRALATDTIGKTYQFKVTAGDGQSSSIFDLQGHKEIWPTIEIEKTIDIVSTTLDEILSGCGNFDGLLMDTQGAELLVLQGADRSLPGFNFIRAEAANFELYKGAVLEPELTNYLLQRGFKLIHRSEWGFHPDGRGNCSDLVFARG